MLVSVCEVILCKIIVFEVLLNLKLLYVMLLYVKFCLQIVRGKRRRLPGAGTGIYNQKQQLHTKMWGMVGLKAGKIKFILNYFLIMKVFSPIRF